MCSQLVNSYKYCMVPLCTNTTVKSPDKIFVHVPFNPKIRKLWFEAARREEVAPKSVMYCCEDHFDLPSDMENWVKYQLMPNTPKAMKKGVVPHKFTCQPDHKRVSSNEIRSVVIKRQRVQIMQDLKSKSTSTLTEELENLEYNKNSFKNKLPVNTTYIKCEYRSDEETENLELEDKINSEAVKLELAELDVLCEGFTVKDEFGADIRIIHEEIYLKDEFQSEEYYSSLCDVDQGHTMLKNNMEPFKHQLVNADISCKESIVKQERDIDLNMLYPEVDIKDEPLSEDDCTRSCDIAKVTQ